MSQEPGKPRVSAVATRDLSKVYSVGSTRLAALNRVSVTIEAGSFVAIVGTSGSGKSTLLNMLGGLEQPTAGEVYVAGLPLHELSQNQLVAYRRQHVGFIFQSFNLLPALSAIENVALPLSFRGVAKKHRLEIAKRTLIQLGLGAHLTHRPTQLSGGQQQRVGIARALASRPKVVFADEPTGNLDSKTAEQTLNLFRTVNRKFGQTWVMVTHDAHIASFADQIISIGDGRITGVTTTEHAARPRPTTPEEALR